MPALPMSERDYAEVLEEVERLRAAIASYRRKVEEYLRKRAA